jgi:tRNA(Arg) A34 adenosine deaminase TadA
MSDPKRDQKFIETAFTFAADQPQFADARIGAILVIRKEIIAYGFNTDKKHPLAIKHQNNKNSIYPHAELMAIYNAAKRLSWREFRKSTLYVARAKKNIHGETLKGLAKPCVGCRTVIEQFRIKRVLWTDDYVTGEWFRGNSWD